MLLVAQNSLYTYNQIPETLEDQLKHLDEFGGPHSDMTPPLGWAIADNTPFAWAQGITSYGGTTNGVVIHFKTDVLPVYKKAKVTYIVRRRGLGSNTNDVTLSPSASTARLYASDVFLSRIVCRKPTRRDDPVVWLSGLVQCRWLPIVYIANELGWPRVLPSSSELRYLPLAHFLLHL